MKKILFLLAAVLLLAAIGGIGFLATILVVGILGLAVDYLEMIIIAAIIITAVYVAKTLYRLAAYCIGVAATLSWFNHLKKAAEETTQQ